ncbi:WXG100 family type VII secretion target [Terribacillus saccharophilus]|uniref:Proteins of 100 residues with WXG n=1 Tax=Terribacillus saccharophilus TaxID=361277 RepID=A0A075LJR2_9BACI|nr:MULTISPECIES: WXG100 family type VII secretion target [Terribacillus]AIF66172.1 hypothetical protein GZ22_05755 [Terribacillus goriensis]MCM3225144.1 WXG100 family type VII secretion target [Terribacillus saccharophilus]MEC0281346.1 WXG100 family type VII secretion target [Terribacillus saccharophilus]MEC0289546.1 WXG100 family type VII secretion target [Terribacillus saccharophilus]SEM82421.1 Proteins of 100 residues with WXG [Terribacillus saccharophilus]
MAKDVIIDQAELDTAKSSASKLKESLDNTYSQGEALLSLVQGSKWEGKSRDSFLAYLELLLQYHADLKDAASLQKKALDNIADYQADFQNDNLVKEVKSL